jgi:hypothetical protein
MSQMKGSEITFCSLAATLRRLLVFLRGRRCKSPEILEATNKLLLQLQDLFGPSFFKTVSSLLYKTLCYFFSRLESIVGK